MKKMISMILVFMMLLSAAFAQETENRSAKVMSFAENELVQADLDGDGADENVIVKLEGPQDEEALVLYITDSDGKTWNYETILCYSTALLICDMNSDGRMEIIISGDMYSDDYSTWCLNYDGETGITPLLFADANRGENTDEYFDSGYGRVTQIKGTQMVLMGSQDVLGTWMASRTFELRDGRFEFADDGLWVMKDLTQDEEMWDYYCLIPTRAIPVTFDDGSEGSIGMNDKFMVMKSDKASIVYFQTIKGWKGSFEIQPDPQGWGSIIDGESEETLFEYVPYAD